MSEATIQARLMAALAPLVAEGSVLLNDHETAATASRHRSPWLVVELADTVKGETANFRNATYVYEPYVALIVFPHGSAEKKMIDTFQVLRQQVVAALMETEDVEAAETAGGLARYPNSDGLIQRLRVRVTEYQV